HENWDGSGYPSGLKGIDIPIGARILSVVDCFDALTSDRPYRPRLSNEEALRILLARRDSMYDPLVVDIFMQAHTDLAPGQMLAGPRAPAVKEISHLTQNPISLNAGATRLDEITASSDER